MRELLIVINCNLKRKTMCIFSSTIELKPKKGVHLIVFSEKEKKCIKGLFDRYENCINFVHLCRYVDIRHIINSGLEK